jgi:hypothetical protein
VPAFSLREAMAYLFDRLTTGPDQRSGAYDLTEDLGGEPAAMAQASAVMAGSGTGCRGYQGYFARHRERLRAAAAGSEPPAAAVTWMLSANYAEELLPTGGTWPLLVLAALLGSHGIPRAVLETWPDDHPSSGWPRSCGRARPACCAMPAMHSGTAAAATAYCLAAGRSLAAARLAGPAVTWWREVAVRCERLLGTDHPDTLTAAGQLTDALLTAGQHDGAVQCARYVLDGRDRVPGPGHPAATTARITLGRALAASGEPGEVLQVLRDAAAHSERAYGHGDPTGRRPGGSGQSWRVHTNTTRCAVRIGGLARASRTPGTSRC